MGRMKVITIGALALAAAVLLGACSNPFDIFGAVKTDVMRANNKFLLVTASGPEKNATDVNPAEPIWIEFDRDLDTETVTAEAISFSPAVGFNFSYDDDNRRLSVTAALDGGEPYTITLTKNLQGLDGSTLEAEYSWSFTTSPLPSGNIIINGGSSYVSPAGSAVTLALTYNNKVAWMRWSWDKSDFINPANGWTNVLPATIDTPLAPANIGTHTVYVQFRDADMNTTPDPSVPGSNPISDSIINGTVTISPCLNTAAKGTVALSWTPAPRQDSGTNTYMVYKYALVQFGKIWTWRHVLMGETTGSSISLPVDQGTIYTLDVRIYNDAVGGYGEYSNQVYGFSSDITVVYNSGDSADVTTANNIVTALTTNLPVTYSPVITGTMPSRTVTLFPQANVSTTASAANTVYGWPVIVTPNTTLYGNVSQSYNVTAHGHGVIAMGTGGARLLDTVATNWAGWGFTGQSPADIGYGDGASGITNNYMYTWMSGNSTWSNPLQSTSIPADNTRVQISYASFNRRSIYRELNANPPGGFIYGRDDQPVGNYYFPVVRQGRFLHFGFYGLPDRPLTGYVYWVNLTNRMSSIYY